MLYSLSMRAWRRAGACFRPDFLTSKNWTSKIFDIKEFNIKEFDAEEFNASGAGYRMHVSGYCAKLYGFGVQTVEKILLGRR